MYVQHCGKFHQYNIYDFQVESFTNSRTKLESMEGLFLRALGSLCPNYHVPSFALNFLKLAPEVGSILAEKSSI